MALMMYLPRWQDIMHVPVWIPHHMPRVGGFSFPRCISYICGRKTPVCSTRSFFFLSMAKSWAICIITSCNVVCFQLIRRHSFPGNERSFLSFSLQFLPSQSVRYQLVNGWRFDRVQEMFNTNVKEVFEQTASANQQGVLCPSLVMLTWSIFKEMCGFF